MWLKKLLILICLCIPFAGQTKNAVLIKRSLLVLDEDDSALPKNFRYHIFNKNRPFVPNASASGQFSERTLRNILPHLKGKVWIIDLRRESHGFVNGIPVSWFYPQNSSNQSLSNEQILLEEQKKINALKGVIVVHDILSKSQGEINQTRDFVISVKSAETEGELTQRLHVNYFRLAVRDHHRPSDEIVDCFIEFIKTLPPNSWLHFHCRGGKGRSTAFITLYDMLLYGKKRSFQEVMAYHLSLGGSDLMMLPSGANHWKRKVALARKKFMMQFYQYATDPKGYPQQSWSQWLLTQ